MPSIVVSSFRSRPFVFFCVRTNTFRLSIRGGRLRLAAIAFYTGPDAAMFLSVLERLLNGMLDILRPRIEGGPTAVMAGVTSRRKLQRSHCRRIGGECP